MVVYLVFFNQLLLRLPYLFLFCSAEKGFLVGTFVDVAGSWTVFLASVLPIFIGLPVVGFLVSATRVVSVWLGCGFKGCVGFARNLACCLCSRVFAMRILGYYFLNVVVVPSLLLCTAVRWWMFLADVTVLLRITHI